MGSDKFGTLFEAVILSTPNSQCWFGHRLIFRAWWLSCAQTPLLRSRH